MYRNRMAGEGMDSQTDGKERLEQMTQERIDDYLEELRNEEKSEGTIQSYGCALRKLMQFTANDGNGEMTKALLLRWKEDLKRKYASSTVNTMIAALNGYLAWEGRPELRVRPVKVQRDLFDSPEKVLTKKEYQKLVHTAIRLGKERLSLILQTICATGIRISELRYITVQALRKKKTEIDCKGKRRVIFLPPNLIHILKGYVAKEKIKEGSIFVSRSGKPLDRSNIWREMKMLCGQAGVSPEKVFPHNLRHLFARTYHSQNKDISKLADVLGHSSVDTTRIYVKESGDSHARQIGLLDLILTT